MWLNRQPIVKALLQHAGYCLIAWQFNSSTMMRSTRHRPHALRTVTVPVHGAGQPTPLSIGERARKELYGLLKGVPTRQHVLIPRNQTEAHRRPDSLCVRLGIPFRVLGPLLFAASILLVNNRSGGLSVSPEGIQLLQNSYTWQEHQQLHFEEKKPSEKALEADSCIGDDPPPARMKFYYIYRGQIIPNYCYKPLAANDLVIDRSINKVKRLSDNIIHELEPTVAALFEDPAVISVNSGRRAGEEEIPNLITPTESQEQHLQSPRVSRCFARATPNRQQQQSFQSPRMISSIRSPPARTPGASPPLQRVRLSANEVETVYEEEEKKEGELPPPPVQPAPPTVEEEISTFLALDFDLRDNNGLRPARNPVSKPIRVKHDRKQATAAMRGKIVWLADQLGYRSTRSKKDKQAIAEAASCVVFYDCGFPTASKGTMLAAWFNELDRARQNLGADFSSALETDQLGPRKGTYVDRIEAAHPNYLRELYRKAGKNPAITFRATFAELADEMNRLSRLEADRPNLFLTRATLKSWFHCSGGKVRKGWERPILTPDRMKARVEWCKARKAELAAAKEAGPNRYHQKYYCFLDEKWFYIRSRRKKLKVLPRGPYEAEGAEEIPMERESSRRHATKVIVLGVIADPVEEFDFDGKIYFTRVARKKKLQKTTYSDKLFDDLAANTALHRQWHGFVNWNDSSDQIISFVAGTVFDMDEDMKQRLVIRYKDHTAAGKTKWKQFSSFQTDRTISPQPDAARHPLDTRDLVLQARYKVGDEVPEDVSCDSEFMKEHMDSIGRAIRAKYHWVPENDEIFLVMDNAGGHGTQDTIEKYVAGLLEDHKVRVLWQEPRGPELNLLDLGAWMSLQSAVEKHFRGNRNDVEVLWRKIQDVWGHYDSTVFRKVWDRWVLALDLVIADGGNNRLVNEHRGSLFTAAAPPPEEEEEELAPPAEDYDLNADNDDGDGDRFEVI